LSKRPLTAEESGGEVEPELSGISAVERGGGAAESVGFRGMVLVEGLCGFCGVALEVIPGTEEGDDAFGLEKRFE
jgi:hypothetical protein